MRAVRLHDHGGADVLATEQIDRPTPGANEVRVEVAAAGVNPVDTYFREGSYEPVTLPFTPGVDVAGIVDAIGADVTSFAAGDRVFGTGIGNGDHQGAYAEYATVPTDRLVALPDDVSLLEAGAAGVVGGTAWRALIGHASLEPAEHCMIHGGSGGVGHVAVQLAAAAGAQVVTTAAPKYHDRLHDLGADIVLDYGRSDLAAAIEAATDGVNVILDHRLDDYLQFDADVAATGCRVVGIGENDPRVELTDDGVARSKDVSFQFMSLFNAPDVGAILGSIASLMEREDIRIAVARRYGLDEAAEAQRAVMEESVFGKLVIEP